MRIELHTIQKMVISEAGGLDPVHVIFEDLGPRHGKVTIEVYGQAWSAYWGGIGDADVRKFFRRCDNGYLAGKLSDEAPMVFDDDPDVLQRHLKAEILKLRKDGTLDSSKARDLWWDAERVGGLESYSTAMASLYGFDWYEHPAPQKDNPKYNYLLRIIAVIKRALDLQPEMWA